MMTDDMANYNKAIIGIDEKNIFRIFSSILNYFSQIANSM